MILKNVQQRPSCDYTRRLFQASRSALLVQPKTHRFSYVSQADCVLPKEVKIVEVGPRDGLQNEKKMIIPTHIKLEMIHRLATTGLRTIEATSFVKPSKVPQVWSVSFRDLVETPPSFSVTDVIVWSANQMADCKDLMKGLQRDPLVSYPVLVPTIKYSRTLFLLSSSFPPLILSSLFLYHGGFAWLQLLPRCDRGGS